MKIAVVVQRYGDGVLGGAETHARQLAERLHTELGWDVEVYTTTAKDYRTWAPYFPCGDAEINGVKVRRFSVRRQRTLAFSVFNRLTAWPLRLLRLWRGTHFLARRLEWVWFVLQGPYSPDLVAELARRSPEYDRVLFVTYLYYPTVAGAPRVGDKAALVPLAHDEAPFWFLTTRDLLRLMPVILPNTEPEARLIARQLDGAVHDLTPVGVGIEAPVSTASGRGEAGPYVLYLGRLSAGKGVGLLIAWFQSFCARPGVPAGLKLVLAGQLEPSVRLPVGDPRVDYLGFVDDERRQELVRGAAVLVNPSPHESMSLIVLEALALRVPVLVNGECEVLRHYAEQVPTVSAFVGEDEFSARLAEVLAVPWREAAYEKELDAARAWVLRQFSWNRVLETLGRRLTGPGA